MFWLGRVKTQICVDVKLMLREDIAQIVAWAAGARQSGAMTTAIESKLAPFQ